MREQNTASHDVNELELGLDSPQSLACRASLRLLADNLDAEVIVGVTLEPFITISRDLILPIGLSHRRSDVVRVKASVGRHVVNANNVAILDVGKFIQSVPGTSTVDGFAIYIEWLRLVLQEKHVVLVLVRVQSNLLLLGSSRVHERMGVEVATLGVDVADSHSAAHEDVNRDVTHALRVQSGLELGAHETVALAGIDKAHEVDSKHGHVEGHGDNDQAEDARHEVFGKNALGEMLARTLRAILCGSLTIVTVLVSPSSTQS